MTPRKIAFAWFTIIAIIFSSACTAEKITYPLSYRGQSILDQPVQLVVSESKTGTKVHSPGNDSFKWRQSQKAGDGLSWVIDLENLTDQRRAIDVSLTLTLKPGQWQALFTGINDHPEWPDEGDLHYVYIRSQDSMTMDNWNARAMLTIPYGCFYDSQKNIGLSFVGDSLDKPYNTVYFKVSRDGEKVVLTITRPRVRLEPKGSNQVKFYSIAHSGDWRSGLAWMVDRWRDGFDVPAWTTKMHSTRYDSASGSGHAEPGNLLTDEYWTDRQKHWLWKDTGMIQSRGFDPWYGIWVPEKEPWRANIGHKFRHMYAAPGNFPKEILDARPKADAPWREQVKFIEELDFKFSPSVRRHVQGNISSLYGSWEWLYHKDVHQLNDRIHDMGWYSISHFDIDEAFAPWLAQEFPESAYPGSVFYAEPIWKVPDAFPGSRWEKHIVDQARKLFEIWPGYDGLMMDQMYYEFERKEADDGITVTADGQPASNLIRNNGRVMEQLHNIATKNNKVIWGNHARTYFAMTRWCDLVVTEGTAVMGLAEDPGKYVTLGTRGGHGLAWGEIQNQNNILRGWTTSLWNHKSKQPLDISRSERDYEILPYFSLLEMFPGSRWQLSDQAIKLPPDSQGNIFRRDDGNVIAAVVSYGVSMHQPWWHGNVPVTVTLPDANTIKGVYLISADHLGPKKLPFKRTGKQIDVTIPLHRSVSMLVFAKTGRFSAVDANDLVVQSGKTHSVRLWQDDWTKGTSTSKTLSVAADDAHTVEGFVRITVPYDPTALLPKADALPGNTSTIELIAADRLLVSVAPPQTLIDRCMSNSSTYTKGWTGIIWAHPLSMNVGEQQVFNVTLYNPSEKPVTAKVAATGRLVSIEDAPPSITIKPRGSVVVPLTIKGTNPGSGGVDVTVTLSDGATIKQKLDLRVVGLSITPDQLAHVKSASMIFDSWYSPNTVGGIIKLNGVKAGTIPINGGYAGWTKHQPMALSAEAAKAIKPKNTLSINTGGRHFKMRHVILQLTLDDGKVIHLPAKETRPQSVPSDWFAAEGVRLKNGQQMVWTFE